MGADVELQLRIAISMSQGHIRYPGDRNYTVLYVHICVLLVSITHLYPQLGHQVGNGQPPKCIIIFSTGSISGPFL